MTQLDHTQPDLQKELFETLKWWVSEQDFDGFRLDAAGGVSHLQFLTNHFDMSRRMFRLDSSESEF